MAEMKSQKIIRTSEETSSKKKSRRDKSERRERESVRLGEENIQLEETTTPVVEKSEKKVRSEKSSRKKQAVVEFVPEPVVESVPEPVVEKKVSKRSKKERVAVKEEESVAEVKSEEVVEESAVPFSVADLTFSKLKVTEKEELDQCFEQYAKALEYELEQTRLDKSRKVNVKTWRLLLTEIRRLKNISLKVMKKPKRRTENTQSGFMKPVRISKELASFAGWSVNDLRSRVEVTKFICNYVKQNNLQNPSDRRQILVDDKLGKLLNHSSSSSTPLTYYLLQKKIQPHFIV